MTNDPYDVLGLTIPPGQVRTKTCAFSCLKDVAVVVRGRAETDTWATTLMVSGPDRGTALARQHRLDALFLLRDDDGDAGGAGIGRVFSDEPAAIAIAERR